MPRVCAMVSPTIGAVAAAINPTAAQLAVAGALATVGAVESWTSETIEWVVQDLLVALPAGIPSPTDSDDDEALTFWRAVDDSRD